MSKSTHPSVASIRLLLLGLGAILIIGACTDSGATSPGSSSGANGTSAVATDRVAPPTPASTPAPATFKAITLSGKGSLVPKFTIPEDAPAIAVISEKGSSNFVVTSLAADGSDNDLLVNVIGGYTGTVLFDAQNGEHSVAFKVESNGTWTIIIKPITAARAWDGSSKLTGKGDDAILINPASSGLVTLNITHAGKANFVVIGYGGDGEDLMINEIGKYSGQVALADGSYFLTVQADGAWTISPGV